MTFYENYKLKYHFLVNFYSLFLLVTFIPDILGINSSIVTNGVWLLRTIAALWLINKHRKKIYILKFEEKIFLLVAFIYFINLFIDIFLQYYPIGIGNSKDLIGFSLSILVAYSFKCDDSFSSDTSYLYFISTLSIGLILAFFLAVPSPAPLIGRFDANSTVNTIIYGKTGCALAIIAIYGYRNYNFRFSKLIFLFLTLLGILSIMRSGSRSPVVILLAVTAFYFITNFSFIKGIFIIGISSITLWLSLGILVELSELIGSDIVTRLIASIEDGDSRYKNVISIIKDSPILGSFYLIPSGIGKGAYPHNHFLEVFMTTGLLGGLPYVLMVIISLRKSFILLSQKRSSGWIALLFLQAFLYGMFSGNLYSAEDFWGLCFLVLSVDMKGKNNYN